MNIEIKEWNLIKHNWTPLFWATKGSKMEQLLISHGAHR